MMSIEEREKNKKKKKEGEKREIEIEMERKERQSIRPLTHSGAKEHGLLPPRARPGPFTHQLLSHTRRAVGVTVAIGECAPDIAPPSDRPR